MTRKMSLRTRKRWLGYLESHWMFYAMLIPGLVYIIIFKYIPMYGVLMAFKNYNGIGDVFSAPWVGWANFDRLFGARAFKRALSNNIIISVEKLIFGFPSPIILALLIDSAKRKSVRKLTQIAVMLPDLISWVVMYGVIYAVLSPGTGVIRTILELFGHQGNIPNLLAQKSSFRALIIISHIWKSSGTATIVYLAAIMGVDQELYDAAAIDGAGYWRQLWHVTLSGIRTTIATLFILRVGNVMYAGFDQIFAISNDAVISVCDIIDTYVYRIGLTQRSFSLATAAGLFQSATGLLLVLITNYIAKKLDPDSGLM